MVNKHKFSIYNTKKVLHKHGKQWIVVSAALLMMLGGSMIANKVSHADGTANAQVNTVKVAPSNNNHNNNDNTANVTSNNNNSNTMKQSAVANQATNLHSQILRNANNSQNLNSQQNTNSVLATNNNQAVQVAAPYTRVGQSDNAVARLQNLQNLYTMYEDLVNSGLFSNNDNNQVPNNQPMQPSDQPSVPSDHQPVNTSDVTGIRDGLNYRYDPASQSIEFTGGKCTYNGNDSDGTPIFNPYSDTSSNNAVKKATSAKFDSDCDFSGVTNMKFMFSNADNLQSLTLPSDFDTSNVTNMDNMFSMDYNLRSLTLPESFNTSNVTTMSDMFNSDNNLQTLNLPDTFNTSNVSDMNSMFCNDNDLQSLNLPQSFNTSNVTNMGSMFELDNNLPSLTLPSSFDTSDASDMSEMFSNDTDLQTLNLPSSFTVNSDTNTSDMFVSDNNLQVPYIQGYHLSDDNTPSDNTPSDNQPNDSDSVVQQMKDQTLSDINNDRAQYGLSPLQENSDMMKVAQERANQTANLGQLQHYDSNGQMYETDDANDMGIDLGDYWGENLAGAGLGNMTMEGDPNSFDNQNGNDMANMDEDAMFNHDQDSGWGHRENILSNNFSTVGIGVAQGSDGTYYLAEDFGNND